MNVAFVDLKRQNRLHRAEYKQAINRVVGNADFILGQDLIKFETAFAKFCGAKYCLGLNSGTDALEFALRAVGIKPGDEIITAPNSYFSTAMIIKKSVGLLILCLRCRYFPLVCWLFLVF